MQTIIKNIQPYTELPKGEFVTLSYDYAGQLLILISINLIDDLNENNGASGVEKNLNQQQRYQVWQTTDDSDVLSLYAEIRAEVDFHDVQRFTNGNVLLVSKHSEYRGENDYDENGYIYSINGELREQLLLGEGVAEVQITKDDTIWVSYYDQGISGYNGWYSPIGSSGLIAWNADGEKLYEFEPSSGLHIIEDCYALNVAMNTATYAYYFYNGEFDLVHIQNQKIINYWHMPVSGSSAFIINSDKAVFDGGYYHRTLFYLVELKEEHQAQIMGQIIFEHDGENILKVGEGFSYPWSRGDSFVVIKNRDLFVIPFAEFSSR